jgi:hypothetical protein
VKRGQQVAATIDESVYVRMGDFTRFAVNGWGEPWLPEAAHHNRVVGGAVVAAAMEFHQGGLTVVVDGTVFPRFARKARGGVPLSACAVAAPRGRFRARGRDSGLLTGPVLGDEASMPPDDRVGFHHEDGPAVSANNAG